MAQKLYEESNIQAIADAIRNKNGTNTTYKTSEMAEAINGLEIGGSGDMEALLSRTITSLDTNATVIGDHVCYQCRQLKTVNLPYATSIEATAFGWCVELENVSFSNHLTTIKADAFQYCTSLKTIELPSSLLSIDFTVFNGCGNLTTVTFKGTPQTIKNGAFSDCSKLTDIYVPWAEGEVANAPWGATNATIHYNHTV